MVYTPIIIFILDVLIGPKHLLKGLTVIHTLKLFSLSVNAYSLICCLLDMMGFSATVRSLASEICELLSVTELKRKKEKW